MDHQNDNEEVHPADKAYQQLVYAVSHDMGGPLRAICSFAELLEERVGEGDETSARYAQRVVAGALQLRSMLDGLLTHSRVGRDQPASTSASVETAWFEALTGLQDELRDATVEAGPSLPSVRCDPNELRLLFSEALKNAVKFRHYDRRLEVRLSAHAEADGWHLTVTDNGIGLPPEYCNRAFDVFSRLHGEQYPGAGMGLAIVRRITSVWNGTALLESLGDAGISLHIMFLKEPT